MRLPTALVLLLVSPALASAQLRFVQPTADLGELRGGLVYQQRFEFVNDAPGPIDITDIRLGCGCLTPVLDKRVLQAGEKGSLVMHLRTLGQPNGPRTWQAHVEYRHAGKMHETRLIVAAKIRNEVTVEPSIVALTLETTLKQEVTITDQRTAQFKVTSVLASSPALRVTTQSTKDGVTKVFLEVSRSALTAARQEETLNIYTDDPHYRHLQVPITLMKADRPDVSATPAKVEINGAGSQMVRLRAVGEQAVRIEKIDADHPAIKCTWAPGPGNDATLKIAADAWRLPAADVAARVRVQVGTTALTIPVLLRRD